MNDYEGQEYDDQWFKNMEALEAYDDAPLDDIDAEEINRRLDILALDYAARENGEKPAAEWERADFKDLLHQYPRLRHWRTCELQAVSLNHTGTINHVEYYKRLSMMETWERIANGGPFNYDLADPIAIDEDSEYAFERREMEVDRLWRLYHRLRPFTKRKQQTKQREHKEMTSIKFTRIYRDAHGEKDYQLLIDGRVYEYIPSLDSLMDDKTGEIAKRLNLPTNVLKAFHKAWNPMEYEGPHMTVDGVPDDTEDPDSPLYYPAKPEGDPVGVIEQEEKPTRSYTQRVVAHLVMNPNIW